jgi:hypothetical protein
MRCSKCGADTARAIPGKLPLCAQCDALLRPKGWAETPDDQPAEPPRREGFFQGIANEFGQYKTQFFWLFVGVGVFGFAMLVLLCCSCGFFLPIPAN